MKDYSIVVNFNRKDIDEMKTNSKQPQTDLTKIAIKAQGGENVLDALFMQWSNKIKLGRVVEKKIPNHCDAQDVKQEVYLSLFEDLNKFNSEKSNFETWASWKMKEVISGFIRSEKRRRNPVLTSGKNQKLTEAHVVSIEIVEPISNMKMNEVIKKEETIKVKETVKRFENKIRQSQRNRRKKLSMIFTFRRVIEETPKEDIVKSLKFWNLINEDKEGHSQIRLVRNLFKENYIKEVRA